jgi:hypothetical protein
MRRCELMQSNLSNVDLALTGACCETRHFTAYDFGPEI